MKWLRQASIRVALEAESTVRYNLDPTTVHDRCLEIAKGSLDREKKIQAIDGVLKDMAIAADKEDTTLIQIKSVGNLDYSSYSDTPDQVLDKLEEELKDELA